MFTMSIMVNKSKYNNKYSKKGYSQERCSKHSYSPPRGHIIVLMSITRLSHMDMLVKEEAYVRKARR